MISQRAISDKEFSQFQRMIYDIAGIKLSDAKKPLVTGRLAKRLSVRGASSYGEYFSLLASGQDPGEVQIAVDLLTTNETYFFREPKHFDFLRTKILPSHSKTAGFRVWSAASSSGQEAYSISMLLGDKLGDSPWEIIGTDISTRVLERARAGHYALEQAQHIPKEYLSRFCLKGVGMQEGTFLVERGLRARTKFMHANLNRTLPHIGEFNLIFLRNVMIYFDTETKRDVVRRVVGSLKSGGHLFIGHSESLNGVDETLKLIAPSIYRKP
ncbi:MAG: CheR family methyltransferase [Burkholderiales bacterium]